jgi:hypothetical protein
MSRRIVSAGLTTCDTIDDGAVIRLGLVDQHGQPISIELPFAQAQSLVMTLPGLLSEALRRHMNDQAARFVFGLGRWMIEKTERDLVILTVATEDGFEVCFGVPFAACRAMGWALTTSPLEPVDQGAKLSEVH